MVFSSLAASCCCCAENPLILAVQFSRAISDLIIAEKQKSAILITHDIGEAITMADRVLVLSQRPSTVVRELMIDIPRDARDAVALRSDPRFNDMFITIWNDIQGKVAA